jgi:hypothetical protein
MTRLDDSIPIITSIHRVPLIHIIVGLGRVIQVIQIINHPRWALLIVPHENVEEAGLGSSNSASAKITSCVSGASCVGTISTGFSSLTVITLGAVAGGAGIGGGATVGVVSILVVELHDELIARHNHSFQLGLLLPQLLA